jgi:hypothetical protein
MINTTTYTAYDNSTEYPVMMPNAIADYENTTDTWTDATTVSNDYATTDSYDATTVAYEYTTEASTEGATTTTI